VARRLIDSNDAYQYVAADRYYAWVATLGTKAARTEIVCAWPAADFDRRGRLIGIEVLDISEVLQHKVQFQVSLTPVPAKDATT